MNDEQRMRRIDDLLSHVWMVRAFIKHSEEAEEDDELCDVQRGLYDYMLAVGSRLASGDAAGYLKTAKKKFTKLRRTCDLFLEIQPEISSHTNFKMAAQSLKLAVDQVENLLQ